MEKIFLDISRSDISKFIPKFVKTDRALQQQLMANAQALNRLNKLKPMGVIKTALEKKLIADTQSRLTRTIPLMKKRLEKKINDLVAAKTLGWVKLNAKGGNRFVLVDGIGCIIQGFDQRVITKTDTVKKHQITSDEFKAHAERREVEDNLPYMYGDGAGNLTVGIGHKIKNEIEAMQLPFYKKLDDDGKNTMVEHEFIKEEYLRLLPLTTEEPNLKARAFESES